MKDQTAAAAIKELLALIEDTVPAEDRSNYVTRDQRVISAISMIASDDFCDALDCDAAFRPDKLTDREKVLHEKLSLIYQLAHSHDQQATCYRVHGDWRKRLEAVEEDQRQEEAGASSRRNP